MWPIMASLSVGAIQADALFAPALRIGARHAQDLMLVVGRAADGMIVSSRRRLLAHLQSGDGEGAALEMEKHLRSLVYMGRLVPSARKTTASVTPI